MIESIDCTSISFWRGMGILIIGATALVVYMNYYVKRGEVQDFGRYWYHYPANEVLVPFIAVQFVAMIVLLLAPERVPFHFVVWCEAVLFPSYLLHGWLCYHKCNPFTPPERMDSITPVTVYRRWKVVLGYGIPCALLAVSYLAKDYTTPILWGYALLATVGTLWLALSVCRAIRREASAVWKLPIDKASTFLLYREPCFKTYITVDLLNRNPRVEVGEAPFSLWRKVVYFHLFDTIQEATAHKLFLQRVAKRPLDTLIYQQNPTMKDRWEALQQKRFYKINL